MNTKRILRLSVLTAVALILSLVENSLPPIFAFAPGAKMGLANVVTLLALIIMTPLDATIILIARCLLMSIFGGNVTSLLYSLPAGLASLLIEMLLYNLLFPKVSLMAVSFVGAITHNIMQVIVASLITSTNLLLMLPLMLIASVVAGLFVGISVYYLVKYLPKSVYIDHKIKKKII